MQSRNWKSYIIAPGKSALPQGEREGANFMLLVWSKRTECYYVCLIYSENPQGKEEKEGQKKWPDLEEGSEAELKGELIMALGSDAEKHKSFWNLVNSKSMQKFWDHAQVQNHII